MLSDGLLIGRLTLRPREPTCAVELCIANAPIARCTTVRKPISPAGAATKR